MEARELRIGNLVLLTKDDFKTTKEYRLDGIDIYKLDESDCIDIKPIPLTTELYRKIEKQLIRKGFSYGFEKGKLTLYLSDEWEFKSEFLHQLQNLYFALTNTELCLDKKTHE